jgi:hypothetical protein
MYYEIPHNTSFHFFLLLQVSYVQIFSVVVVLKRSNLSVSIMAKNNIHTLIKHEVILYLFYVHNHRSSWVTLIGILIVSLYAVMNIRNLLIKIVISA